MNSASDSHWVRLSHYLDQLFTKLMGQYDDLLDYRVFSDQPKPHAKLWVTTHGTTSLAISSVTLIMTIEPRANYGTCLVFGFDQQSEESPSCTEVYFPPETPVDTIINVIRKALVPSIIEDQERTNKRLREKARARQACTQLASAIGLPENKLPEDSAEIPLAQNVILTNPRYREGKLAADLCIQGLSAFEINSCISRLRLRQSLGTRGVPVNSIAFHVSAMDRRSSSAVAALSLCFFDRHRHSSFYQLSKQTFKFALSLEAQFDAGRTYDQAFLNEDSEVINDETLGRLPRASLENFERVLIYAFKQYNLNLEKIRSDCRWYCRYPQQSASILDDLARSIGTGPLWQEDALRDSLTLFEASGKPLDRLQRSRIAAQGSTKLLAYDAFFIQRIIA